jgi:hypothetical protein
LLFITYLPGNESYLPLVNQFHQNARIQIFMTTDASNKWSGAVLSFGSTWDTAWPVAIHSMTFKSAELNYPIHEKELLTVI